MKTHRSYFTPSQMLPEQLEKLFVVRGSIVKRILDGVRDGVEQQNCHNYLLDGPRGIGKTHLVSLVQNRIRSDAALTSRLIISRCPEDPYFSGYNDFLLMVIRSIDAPEKKGETQRRIDQILDRIDEDEAQEALEALLREILGDRMLLLIAENFDDILDALRVDGQQKLRAFAQNHGRVSFIVTTTSLQGVLESRDHVFFGTFESIPLHPFTVDEAQRLLVRMAELDDDQALADYIASPAGHCRIYAVHFLAGGNPRIYAIFFEFINRDSLAELVGPVMKTIENLTPYYQSRMDRLSPLQRRIIDIMRQIGKPTTSSEIARQAMNPPQSISTQIGRLEKLGYISLVEEAGRYRFYEMREPLMRLCLDVKDLNRSTIELFVRFMRIWYSKPQLLKLRSDNLGSMERRYIDEASVLEDPLGEPLTAQFNARQIEGNSRGALETAEDGLTRDPEDARFLRMKIDALAILDDRPSEELSCLQQWVKAESGDFHAWSRLGSLNERLKHFDEAVFAHAKACELKPEDATLTSNLARALHRAGRSDEERRVIEEAEKLLKDPQTADEWLTYGGMMAGVERNADALVAYAKAVEMDPENLAIWRCFLGLLQWLCLFSATAKLCNLLVRYNSGNPVVSVWSGYMKRDIGLFEESIVDFKRAFQESAPSHPSEKSATTLPFDDSTARPEKVVQEDIFFGQSPALAIAISLDAIDRTGEAYATLENASAEIERCDVSTRYGAKLYQAIFLLTLDQWDGGASLLDEVLAQYQPSGDYHSDFRACNQILVRIQNPAIWRRYIALYIECFSRHHLLPELGSALVESIKLGRYDWIGLRGMQSWLETWRDLAGEIDELKLPLLLLQASVAFMETRDSTALLELKQEERKLIESWLPNLFAEETSPLTPIVNEIIEKCTPLLEKKASERNRAKYWSQDFVASEKIAWEDRLSHYEETEAETNFPLLSLLPGRWTTLSKQEATTFVRMVSEKDRLGSIALAMDDLQVSSVRKRPVAFLTGDLYEVRLKRNGRRGVLDILMNSAPEAQVLVLKGQSSQLAAAVADGSIRFDVENSEEASSEYTRFFSSMIRAAEGRFHVLETMDDLTNLFPINGSLDRGKEKFQPWTSLREAEDLTMRGTIYHNGALFLASFRLNQRKSGGSLGFVEMLDDEPIEENLQQIEDLDGPIRWSEI